MIYFLGCVVVCVICIMKCVGLSVLCVCVCARGVCMCVCIYIYMCVGGGGGGGRIGIEYMGMLIGTGVLIIQCVHGWRCVAC